MRRLLQGVNRMGYQIEYHLQKIQYTKCKDKKRLPVLATACLLALSMIAAHYCAVTLQTVISGQWGDTIAASDQMVNALQNGSSIREAVQVFCAELIP